ncbi:MAG: hypothetical protein ACRDY7_05865 [Acidimicrobiia bacterium]
MATPASWVELDVGDGNRAASAARFVESAPDQLGPDGRAELARMAETAVAEAAAKGAVYVACYSAVVEERPVSASLVVSVIEGRDRPPPPGATRHVMAQGLARVLGGAGTVAVRDLPAGPAVRVRTRAQAPVPFPDASGEQEAEVENVQWFVPSADGRQLALLAFSTPTLGLAESFGELFDAIAGTLRWE